MLKKHLRKKSMEATLVHILPYPSFCSEVEVERIIFFWSPKGHLSREDCRFGACWPQILLEWPSGAAVARVGELDRTKHGCDDDKYSISLRELNRTEVCEQVLVLLGVLAEEAASEKVMSTFFLSIGQAARKTFLDKIPAIQYTSIPLPEQLERYGQTFVFKQNRILDRSRFFSRKQ